MKTVLKFSGVIACIFALIAFIMVLACDAVRWEVTLLGVTTVSYLKGTTAMFGGDHVNLAPAALVAFILLIVALVIILAGIILPLAKVTALDKVSGILNLIAVIALIFAGVLILCTKNSYCDANKLSNTNSDLTVGYAFAGIFAIVAGIFAVLPTCANLASKK